MERGGAKLKRFGCIVVFILLGQSVFSLDDLSFTIFKNRYRASLEISGGMLWGNLSERVFFEEGNPTLNSDVRWMVSPIGVLNVGVQLEPVDAFNKIGFSVRGRVGFGFPRKTGFVEDIDYTEEGVEISYSEHDGEYQGYQAIEGELCFLVPFKKKWMVEVLLGVFYRRTKTEASDGYIKGYEEDGYSADSVGFNLYGTAIYYEQQWLQFSPGLAGRLKLNKQEYRLVFFITALQFGEHTDRHYFRYYDEFNDNFRYIIYEDKVRWGLYFRMEGAWMYQMTKDLQAGIQIKYERSMNSRGTTRISSTGFERKREIGWDLAGAAYDGFEINIVIRVGL
jgi:outer membrane protease